MVLNILHRTLNSEMAIARDIHRYGYQTQVLDLTDKHLLDCATCTEKFSLVKKVTQYLLKNEKFPENEN
ncbi:hypothetical protein F7734_10195 [Scytonema sp. UIC 10036]|uniref:hypothetical protein n=1 Tax=Scytonema sp. UIC 10036 TaxID=2304196 RepID=UPI0012DA4A6B|nr:hypothetical protein [Scytonema sp. UIC 10036]MUG92801.1 hypothetical protein [Scytonema sp. UIC 10036]